MPPRRWIAPKRSTSTAKRRLSGSPRSTRFAARSAARPLRVQAIEQRTAIGAESARRCPERGLGGSNPREARVRPRHRFLVGLAVRADIQDARADAEPDDVGKQAAV